MGSSENKYQYPVEISSNAETNHQVNQEEIQLSTHFHGNDENATTDTSENQRTPSIYYINGPSLVASSIVIADADTPDINTCDSCALDEKQGTNKWELVDPNVLHPALHFREELIPWNNNKKQLKKIIYAINKGYLTLRLKNLGEPVAKDIREKFDQACKECNPELIIKAYSLNQSFCKLMNDDMARIVQHDIYRGCSKFSCDTLYTTQDGTKSIASILFYHPEFITHTGTVYRGMFAAMDLSHIQLNRCIMTKTYQSTSKDHGIANLFSGYDESEQKYDEEVAGNVSVFCTFIIKNINGKRRALDISRISTKPWEEEVLVLPYSAFLVTKKETINLPNSNMKRIEIEFEECDDAQLKSSVNEQ